MNRDEKCIDDYTNMLGQSTRIKCLYNNYNNDKYNDKNKNTNNNNININNNDDDNKKCGGKVNLVPRKGIGSQWVSEGQSFQLFCISLFLLSLSFLYYMF